MRIKTGSEIVEVKKVFYNRSWQFGKYEIVFCDCDNKRNSAIIDQESLERLFEYGILDIS